MYIYWYVKSPVDKKKPIMSCIKKFTVYPIFDVTDTRYQVSRPAVTDSAGQERDDSQQHEGGPAHADWQVSGSCCMSWLIHVQTQILSDVHFIY